MFVLLQRILSFQDALDSFEAMFGKGHPAVERFVRMHDQIERWKQERVTGQ